MRGGVQKRDAEKDPTVVPLTVASINDCLDERFLNLRGTFDNICWGGFCKCCTKVYSSIFEAVPDTHAPSHVPCRTDAKQDCERLGTPPTLLRQNSLGRPPNSTGRHTDDDSSLRRRAVKVGGKSCLSRFLEVQASNVFLFFFIAL